MTMGAGAHRRRPDGPEATRLEWCAPPAKCSPPCRAGGTRQWLLLRWSATPPSSAKGRAMAIKTDEELRGWIEALREVESKIHGGAS